MGQYWRLVNLDKREHVDPHKLGCGLKLWEQLSNSPGTGAALVILCAAMREVRGGGDFDMKENWHGPEREVPGKHSVTPGPMPEEYLTVAARTIGRWAGDRIAFVGDYAEDSDLPGFPAFGTIYQQINSGEWIDISDDVCLVIEHELCGRFTGDGWRRFERSRKED